VPTFAEVRAIAMALPEMVELPGPEWRVADKPVAWSRPLRAADEAALGDAAPEGDILGIRVPGLEAQRALVATVEGVFITPHFGNWPAVLVELARVDPTELREMVVEGWLTQAPKRATRPWLEAGGLEGMPKPTTP
jgi:hypothetical protein